MAPTLAKHMQLEGYVNPVDSFGKSEDRCIEREEGPIVTHINLDHISGIELFPQATFYIQQKEFDFWIKDPIAKKPPFLLICLIL